MRLTALSLVFVLSLFAGPVWADFPVVEKVRTQNGLAGWAFSVTLRHLDTGWDDYADAWDVRAPDGTLLGTRKLLHPHVDEQPFTRALSGVAIPAGITQVMIRAHGLVDGWSPKTFAVTLPTN